MGAQYALKPCRVQWNNGEDSADFKEVDCTPSGSLYYKTKRKPGRRECVPCACFLEIKGGIQFIPGFQVKQSTKTQHLVFIIP
jgi:hypothetical protein